MKSKEMQSFITSLVNILEAEVKVEDENFK